MSQRRPQYFIEIGGRVRGNEQHFFSGINQPNRRCTRQRGFADAPLPGEEQVASRMIEKFHGMPSGECEGSNGLWSLSRSDRMNCNTRRLR